MNTKRTRRIIFWIVIIQIVMIGGLLLLPAVVQAIPGRYRVALAERSPFLSDIAEGVINQVAPVATSLPVLQGASDNDEVDIAQLINGESALLSATSEATPNVEEATAVPTDAPTVSAEATELILPTNTPEPTATATAAPSPTPEPLPQQVKLDGMGIIRQTFNNCGPANLTQVLNFHQYDVSQEEVRLILKPNAEDRNVSPWQIQDFVNEQTPYRAIARTNGTLELLKRLIAAGLPVVVEKGYFLQESGWWGHYLTLFGYDEATQKFDTQDSYLGPWDGSGRQETYADIEKYWQEFNYTFYVVYEPAQEELVNSVLGEEMLDDFTMWQMTAVRAEQQTRDNPDDAFAQFNLGTALTAMGELTGESQYYQGGAQAFDNALEIGLPPRMLWYQFRPYWAYYQVGRYDDVIALADATLDTQGGRNVEETFLYKGHALLALGNYPDARIAYQTALQVNANFTPAQINLDYLDSLGG